MYDYVAGKADWIAMGMPTEGMLVQETIHQCARKDVPTCGLNQKLEDVKKAASDEWNICVVVDSNRTVLGLLDLTAVKDDRGTVAEFMKPAPVTLRPGVLMDEALKFLEDSDRAFALVTKSTGELIGVIRADAA